ncbi:uncharacterized protein LOC143159863 [Aptenodytes patagonicus]|uniref:uncharacterized protein LOC143159863 n=1 Tax=Aptenodytes patagonicus TaxID=9234 RepID=UPI003FA0FE5B
MRMTLFRSGCRQDRPLRPGAGSAGAGESSGRGELVSAGVQPCPASSSQADARGPELKKVWARGATTVPVPPVPQEVLGAQAMPRGCANAWGRLIPVPGRGARPCGDERRGTPTGRTWPGRTDRGTDGGDPATPGVEPQEEAGLPTPRPPLTPALRVAPLLAGDSPACARPETLRGPARIQVQLMDGSSSVLAPVRGWFQLLDGSSSVLAPVRGWFQLLDGSSSVLAPVRGWFQLLLASSSFQHQLVLAPVALRLQLICSSLCLLKRSWLLARS